MKNYHLTRYRVARQKRKYKNDAANATPFAFVENTNNSALSGLSQHIGAIAGIQTTAMNNHIHEVEETIDTATNNISIETTNQTLKTIENQIQTLSEQYFSLKNEVAPTFATLMLNAKKKVDTLFSELKQLIENGGKWTDTNIQIKLEKLTELLGLFAQSITLSQTSQIQKVNQDAIDKINQALSEANNHTSQQINSLSTQISQSITTINQDLAKKTALLSEMQKQIDGEVSHYNGEFIPLPNNWPAKDWTTLNDKRRHINDTFTDLRAKIADNEEVGYSWKWVEKPTGTFSWKIIADGNEAAILAELAQHSEALDGKISHYLVKPTKYQKGDLWTTEKDYVLNNKIVKASSILIATKTNNTFDWDDWKENRYTSLEEVKVGGRNLLVLGEWGNFGLEKERFPTTLRKWSSSKSFIIPIEEGKNYLVTRKRKTKRWAVGFIKDAEPKEGTTVYPIAGQKSTIDGGVDFDFNFTVPKGEGYKYLFVYVSWSDPVTPEDGVKVEQGNIPTDYQLAPEDVKKDYKDKITTSSISSKNKAKAESLRDKIISQRAELEKKYLKISPICPKSLTQQLLNTFTTYKGAEETLRNACNSFIGGSDLSDSRYTASIGETNSGGKPHKAYIDALADFTKVLTEADRGKDATEIRPNLLKYVEMNGDTQYYTITSLKENGKLGYHWVQKNKATYPLGLQIDLKAKTNYIISWYCNKEPRNYVYMMSKTFYGEALKVSDNLWRVAIPFILDSQGTYINIYGIDGIDNGTVEADVYNIKLEEVSSKDDSVSPYIPHIDDLKGKEPDIKWQGTKLLINSLSPVDLKGEKGKEGDKGKDGESPERLFFDTLGILENGEVTDGGWNGTNKLRLEPKYFVGREIIELKGSGKLIEWFRAEKSGEKKLKSTRLVGNADPALLTDKSGEYFFTIE